MCVFSKLRPKKTQDFQKLRAIFRQNSMYRRFFPPFSPKLNLPEVFPCLKKTEQSRGFNFLWNQRIVSLTTFSKLSQKFQNSAKIFKTQLNFRENSTKSGSKLNVPEVLPTFAHLKNAQKKAWFSVQKRWRARFPTTRFGKLH